MKFRFRSRGGDRGVHSGHVGVDMWNLRHVIGAGHALYAGHPGVGLSRYKGLWGQLHTAVRCEDHFTDQFDNPICDKSKITDWAPHSTPNDSPSQTIGPTSVSKTERNKSKNYKPRVRMDKLFFVASFERAKVSARSREVRVGLSRDWSAEVSVTWSSPYSGHAAHGGDRCRTSQSVYNVYALTI